MTKSAESKTEPDDYYFASLENGSLTMLPFCGCGNSLDEDYYCEKCRKTCRCHRIVCRDDEAFQRVRRYVRKYPQFSGFRVELADAP